MPILFELFFRSHLDLGLFKINNENYIREIYIQKFTQTSHHNILHKYVMVMLDEYREYTNKICIDRNFPKKILVDKMRDYLQHYLLSKYLIFGSEKRYNVEETLRKKLFKFSRCNPKFGKKTEIFKQKENNPKRLCTIYEYNTECVSFYDETPNIFFVNWKEFENIPYQNDDQSIFEDDDTYDD
jgi:hypothetical protein